MNEPTMETLTRRLDQVEKNEEVGCGLLHPAVSVRVVHAGQVHLINNQ
jgi:hypothetical protein